jgi:hypothetical protein
MNCNTYHHADCEALKELNKQGRGYTLKPINKLTRILQIIMD